MGLVKYSLKSCLGLSTLLAKFINGLNTFGDILDKILL